MARPSRASSSSSRAGTLSPSSNAKTSPGDGLLMALWPGQPSRSRLGRGSTPRPPPGRRGTWAQPGETGRRVEPGWPEAGGQDEQPSTPPGEHNAAASSVWVSVRLPGRGCLLEQQLASSARAASAHRAADAHRAGLRRRYAHRSLALEPPRARLRRFAETRLPNNSRPMRRTNSFEPITAPSDQ